MPGSNGRALEKARDLPADVLIFDLEDAVAPNAKDLARTQVLTALKSGGYGHREILVRINGLDTPWGQDDVRAVAVAGCDGVVLPKVNSPNDVHLALAALTQGGASESLGLWCMMETPRGVLESFGIAASSPRLRGLIMGTSDLAKDLRAAHTPDREPFLTALGLCLLAARACDLAILDGVHLDLDDPDGFERACRQGADMGFDGKTLIHPKTIETANRVFAPSPDACATARRLIDAFEAARADGKGVVVVDGKLVEDLHVTEARRLLALADEIRDRAPGA